RRVAASVWLEERLHERLERRARPGGRGPVRLGRARAATSCGVAQPLPHGLLAGLLRVARPALRLPLARAGVVPRLVVVLAAEPVVRPRRLVALVLHEPREHAVEILRILELVAHERGRVRVVDDVLAEER